MDIFKTNHGEGKVIGTTPDGGYLLSFTPQTADQVLCQLYPNQGRPCFSIMTFWTFCPVCQDRTQHMMIDGQMECQEHRDA